MTELEKVESAELVATPVKYKFRGHIPTAHTASMDTMIQWLWNQRFGTVQTVWQVSQEETDVLAHTAATVILQAIMAKDLESIQIIFNRIEGGAITDEANLADPESIRI